MGFERGAIFALFRRPTLLLEALRTWLAMRRTGAVGLSRSYMGWRTLTAYGDNLTTLSAQDLLEYLYWRRAMRVIRSGSGRHDI
jgi:hypothetical protein